VSDRRVLTLALLVLFVATSGCVGFLTGTEGLTFASSDVSVSAQASDEAGYETIRVESLNRSRTFEAAGQERNVTVVNHVAEYQRSVSLGPLGELPFARFTVLSTPQVEVAGQSFNPLADRSNRELARNLQDTYDRIEDVRFDGNRTVTVLGEARTVSRFTADARIAEGQTIDVYVHVASFRHDEDFLVAVAVHPQRLDEGNRVDTMLSGIEHAGE
jgi:hypothetical protein